MNALHTILTIIQVILAVGLVVIVTIQSGKSAGLSGAIAGGSGDTYLGKNKNKGLDAKLALATKWVGGVCIVQTRVLNLFGSVIQSCSDTRPGWVSFFICRPGPSRAVFWRKSCRNKPGRRSRRSSGWSGS